MGRKRTRDLGQISFRLSPERHEHLLFIAEVMSTDISGILNQILAEALPPLLERAREIQEREKIARATSDRLDTALRALHAAFLEAGSATSDLLVAVHAAFGDALASTKLDPDERKNGRVSRVLWALLQDPTLLHIAQGIREGHSKAILEEERRKAAGAHARLPDSEVETTRESGDES